MKTTIKRGNEKNPSPAFYLWIIFIIFSIITLSISYPPFLIKIIALFISLMCAKGCHNIACRYKKNKTIAFLIGMLFSLIGYIIYGMLYDFPLGRKKGK